MVGGCQGGEVWGGHGGGPPSGGGGGSPCRMSIIRNGNVALSNEKLLSPCRIEEKLLSPCQIEEKLLSPCRF